MSHPGQKRAGAHLHADSRQLPALPVSDDGSMLHVRAVSQKFAASGSWTPPEAWGDWTGRLRRKSSIAGHSASPCSTRARACRGTLSQQSGLSLHTCCADNVYTCTSTRGCPKSAWYRRWGWQQLPEVDRSYCSICVSQALSGPAATAATASGCIMGRHAGCKQSPCLRSVQRGIWVGRREACAGCVEHRPAACQLAYTLLPEQHWRNQDLVMGTALPQIQSRS